MSLLMRSALAGAAGLVLSFVSSVRAQMREEIVSVVGTVVSASVPPGQQNQHRLRIQAGSYVRIAVEPHNCDLAVAISEPDGGGTRVLRTPYGTRNYISVSFLTPQAETATLAVATANGAQTVGSYKIWQL